MIFYTENNETVKYSTNKRIGGGLYGSVYKVGPEECVKKFKSKNMKVDKEALLLIQKLGLNNFCKIKELLYSESKKIIGYLMKYYQSESIDILTMPTDYTIHNLCKLYDSVIKLTQNNIFIDDMHTGNIIMNKVGITIIDYDLYVLNGFYVDKLLKYKNLSLKYLFKEIYCESLLEFHKEYNFECNRKLVEGIFELFDNESLERTCKKLIKYKYPIDYIKKESN